MFKIWLRHALADMALDVLFTNISSNFSTTDKLPSWVVDFELVYEDGGTMGFFYADTTTFASQYNRHKIHPDIIYRIDLEFDDPDEKLDELQDLCERLEYIDSEEYIFSAIFG